MEIIFDVNGAQTVLTSPSSLEIVILNISITARCGTRLVTYSRQSDGNVAQAVNIIHES